MDISRKKKVHLLESKSGEAEKLLCPSVHKIHLLNLFFFSELHFISQQRAPLIGLEMLMGNICGPSPKLEMHLFRTGAATEMCCTWFCDRSRNTVSLTI